MKRHRLPKVGAALVRESAKFPISRHGLASPWPGA
jgi:hypothetical protein